MSKKIALLAAIYDNTYQRIEAKIAKHNKNYDDPMVQKDVLYLATVAELLINVVKIEKARTPSASAAPDASLPEEKPQPDIKPKNPPENPHLGPGDFKPGDFENFPSPGGWNPF